VEGLRPTPDRVRESLFNWLGQDLTGRICLDLFAGSGALAFEAASRGAQQVVCVESNRHAVHAMRATIAKLDATMIEVYQRDAFAFAEGLAQAQARFDVIFLDPPFHQGLASRALALTHSLLASKGVVYLESESRISNEEAATLGLALLRNDRAGQVHYHLLAKAITPEAGKP
jgi:16S rRNA (guanine(966)-N(2))-methyltransferase RsmD